ncbi:TetR family transcriptional regulator, partial [bacterium]
MSVKQSQVRQRVLSAAWKRFAAHGFEAVTMPDIARDCGVETRQVFAQFPAKEELVFELYRMLAIQLEERVVELPEGTIGQRFLAVMDWKIASLEKHRAVLQALFETMTDSAEELGVLGANMELIRHRVRGVFASVAWGASDKPADDKIPELVRHLYRLHLGLIFLWFRNPRAYRVASGTIEPLLALSKSALELGPLHAILERVDKLFQQKVEAFDEEHDLADRVLLRLFRHRRLQTPKDHSKDCAAKPCEQCLALHRSRVAAFISRGEPIQMVLPAFPAKSPNAEKVLGCLPDMAEELALRCLDNLCREIGEIYSPGARIVICSDGHVFSDLVGVSEQQVDDYNSAIQSLILDKRLTSLSFFNLSS